MNSSVRRWFYAIAGLVGLGLLWWVYTQLPVAQWIEQLRLWIVSLGMMGVVLFVALYMLFTVVFGPVTGLNLMAGLAYGLWGFALVVISATLSAAVAFLLGRYVAHARVNHWIAGKPKLQALQRAVSEEGWRVVGLMRLSPIIPFGFQNYLFSVTNIRFMPYVLATMIGLMPSIALLVYIGSLGQSIGEAGAMQWVLVVAGLCATAVVAWVVSRRAAQVLEQQRSTDVLVDTDNPERTRA